MRSQHARWHPVRIANLVIMGFGLIAAPGPSGARVNGDVRPGVYSNADVVLGGGVLAPIGNNRRRYFNPNVELANGDGPEFVAMSGDFHHDFAHDGNAAFWIGGGSPAPVLHRRVAISDRQLGVNLLAGTGAKRGEIRPFAQLRGTVADNGRIAIVGGIRF